MSLALPICLLFISHMQSVNRAQCLNTTFLLLLFGSSLACSVIDIVPLTKVLDLTFALKF